MTTATLTPLVLVAELTHRCPLHCVYCSNPITLSKREAEMPTETWVRIFEEAAAAGVLQADLMPERVLRLNGPSLEIVSRCDGKHSVSQIIGELQLLYSKAEPHKVEQDILSYLALLQNERALDFDSGV